MLEDTRIQRLHVEPYTQWEPEVASPGSACGPATLAALMEYWHTVQGRERIRGKSHFGSKAAHINYIYRRHGGRPWGMSAGRFVRGARAYLAADVSSEGTEVPCSIDVFNDLERYKAEIDAGRPVALKFDKWSKLRWRGRYAYDYHWTLGIGYEETGNADALLLVLDNGARTRGGGFRVSRERRIPYAPNQAVLTMVGVNIGVRGQTS
ncbi:C39 family peptidase [Paenibacillus sp. NFR01]|uniref:C39 family peptidase n=1 Tax=Paenibacillus sp. NFR01 TaxID=1566279 RepID=UPI0008AC30F3|nr:C39 family peptidase [Paenibacillus sp. NFR01]SEU23733.1 Peptidase_C39 like family protein [Paenibacillus sp. NFR01]